MSVRTRRSMDPPTRETSEGERLDRSASLVRPAELDAAAVLALQRSGGNQHVARLLARSTKDAKMNLGGDEDRRPAGNGGGAGGQRGNKVAFDWNKDPSKTTFELWVSADKHWHFSYFPDNGEYHLKGNGGPRKPFQKGYFKGTLEERTVFNWIEKKTGAPKHKNVTANALAEGRRQYQFCITEIVPRYAGLPGYKGPQNF